jgi:hypothetical protein
VDKLLIKDTRGERTYDLHDGQISIGRAETCNIPIDDPMASRHHCTVERVPEGYRVIDNQSRNGTKVNGKQINSHLLKLGDAINIGDCSLTYQGAAGKFGGGMGSGSSPGVRGAAGARRRAGGAAKGLVGPLIGLVVLVAMILGALQWMNSSSARERQEQIWYDEGMDLFNANQYLDARDKFRLIPSDSKHYTNARTRVNQCDEFIRKVGPSPAETGTPKPTFPYLKARSELDNLCSRFDDGKLDGDSTATGLRAYITKYEEYTALDSAAKELVSRAKAKLTEITGEVIGTPSPGETRTPPTRTPPPALKVEDAWVKAQSEVTNQLGNNEFGRAIDTLIAFQTTYELEPEYVDKAQARLKEVRESAKAVWNGGEADRFSSSLKGKSDADASAQLDRVKAQYKGVDSVLIDAQKRYETRTIE